MARPTGGVLAVLAALAVLPIALSLQARQTPPAPTIGTGAISGVVLDGTTNVPLAGVVIFLGPPERSQLGQPIQQLTDDRGRFVFTNLGPHSDGYFINASKPGYAIGHYGRGVGTTPGSKITLTDGEWFSDARVVMYRQSAIRGTVTDEQGDPVVGAYVRALTQLIIGGTQHMAVGSIVKTDDRGVYRLPNLDAGKYIVNVPSVQLAAPLIPSTANPSSTGPALEIDSTLRLMLGRYPMPRPAADGRSRVYAPAFHPGVTTVGEAQVIDLKQAEERQGIDVRLQPVRALRVSGSIVGPAEAVPGLQLRLLGTGAEGLGAGSETATTLVNANGTFTFVNVPSGRYTILARRSVTELRPTRENASGLLLPNAPNQSIYTGMVNTEFDVQPQYRLSSPGGTGAYWGMTRVDVADQDVTGVAVRVQRGVMLTGHTFFEAPGQPPRPSRAYAFAEPANGDVILAKPAVSGTRGSAPPEPGEFTVEGLMAGQYVLRFEVPWAVKSVVWNGRNMTYTPFDAVDGRDISGVSVTFTDGHTTLTGNARDAQNRVAKDAIVIAFPVERAQWSNYGFNSVRIKLSPVNTNGTFRYQNLPAGEYFVVAVDASESDEWRNPTFLEAASSLASRVALDWDATRSVDVKVVQVQVP